VAYSTNFGLACGRSTERQTPNKDANPGVRSTAVTDHRAACRVKGDKCKTFGLQGLKSKPKSQSKDSGLSADGPQYVCSPK
jgi:hypothetical protein